MLFVGVDCAERHHDICLLDDRGAVLAKHRISDRLAGVTFVASIARSKNRQAAVASPPRDTNTSTTWPNWSTALDILGVIAEYFGPK